MKSNITFKIGENTLKVVQYFFENSGMCRSDYQSKLAECTHLHVNTKAKTLELLVKRDLSFTRFSHHHFQTRVLRGQFNEPATLSVDNRFNRGGQSGTYDMEVSYIEPFDYYKNDDIHLLLNINKLSVFEVSAYLESDITSGVVSSATKTKYK